MNIAERLRAIAHVLKLTPGPALRLEPPDRRWRNWWLCGCVEGDQALPRTSHCSTVAQALDATEAWLALLLDRKGAR